MQLEIELDEQKDSRYNLQMKSKRARKQIARMIHKTQTFLVDSERLLKEKLLAVKSMNHEILRLDKERSIIDEAKKKAHYAYLAASDQRTQMRMHYEKIQMERDEEVKYGE